MQISNLDKQGYSIDETASWTSSYQLYTCHLIADLRREL